MCKLRVAYSVIYNNGGGVMLILRYYKILLKRYVVFLSVRLFINIKYFKINTNSKLKILII